MLLSYIAEMRVERILYSMILKEYAYEPSSNKYDSVI